MAADGGNGSGYVNAVYAYLYGGQYVIVTRLSKPELKGILDKLKSNSEAGKHPLEIGVVVEPTLLAGDPKNFVDDFVNAHPEIIVPIPGRRDIKYAGSDAHGFVVTAKQPYFNTFRDFLEDWNEAHQPR